MKLEASYIMLDLERSDGWSDFEILQVSCTSTSASRDGDSRERVFNCHISPNRKINRQASRYSYKLEMKRGHLHRGNVRLQTVTLETACRNFIIHLQEVKQEIGTGKPLTLVTYGPQDVVTGDSGELS